MEEHELALKKILFEIMAKSLQDAVNLLESLKKEFSNKKSDVQACQRLLTQLKVCPSTP
jgi:hypothetical protein